MQQFLKFIIFIILKKKYFTKNADIYFKIIIYIQLNEVYTLKKLDENSSINIEKYK